MSCSMLDKYFFAEVGLGALFCRWIASAAGSVTQVCFVAVLVIKALPQDFIPLLIVQQYGLFPYNP